MKKVYCLVAALLLLPFLNAPASAGMQVQVTLAPMGRSFGPPPLGRKQGWVAISNRDWMDYTLNIDPGGKKLYLYRHGQGWGSVHLPSGSTITLALGNDTWDLYGDGSARLRVRVREGRTTTLSLEPFGFVGNTGLTGIANDGSNVRRETLFAFAAQPIVVAPPPPPIIVHQPPPPVIVTRPPPVVIAPPHRPPPPPPHRPPPPPVHRPPPPPPPPAKRGWGFSLFFD